MKNESLKLGEILVKNGWVAAGAVNEALATQKKTREFLGAILVRDKKIGEEQLAKALSEQSGLPFVRLSELSMDWPLVLRFSASLILEKKCFPLRANTGEITFAITNMLDVWALSQIESECRGSPLRLVLITPKDMNELMTRYREYANIRMQKKLDSEHF